MEGSATALRLRASPLARRVSALRGRSAVAVAAWLGLLAIGWAWGTALNDSGARILLNAPPVLGTWDLAVDPQVLLPVVTAAGVVFGAPALARSLSWQRLLVVAGAGAIAWALALAFTEGSQGVLDPLERMGGYMTALPAVDSPGEFLSTFNERIDGYATHVRGHPPGMVLLLWTLEQVGLGGSLPAALLIVVVAASAVPAALIALRAVAGEEPARRAAPYLVLAPGAVWMAVSGDALFMGVGAWAVTLTVLSIVSQGRRSDLLAAGGGVLFGVTLFLSYGLVLLGAIPLVVAIAKRRVRPLLIATAGVVAVMLVFLAAGFWWLDGFFETRREYLESIAETRPYQYFVLNNLAAFGLAAGVATAVALGRLRDRLVWLLVGGGLLAVALADLSGMSKAEVERIWLPFLPWVMLATAALPAKRSTVRWLLGTQAALGIAIQIGIRTTI